MNKIIKEERNRWTKGPQKVAYSKKYILQQISTDGLVKNDPELSEYEIFDTEDDALEFCATKGIHDLVILPIVTKDYCVD